MKSGLFNKGFFLRVWCIILATSSFMYADTDAAFMDASKAFSSEGAVFESESKQLMNNTHEVDKALQDFEHILMVPHKTSQALITLDNALTTIKLGLSAAEQVPQTRAQAQKLKQDLESVHKPIASASETMKKVDDKIFPLLKATHKAEVTAAKLVDVEDSFRTIGMNYINTVGKVSQCDHDAVVIAILQNSRTVYSDIDKEMKNINNTYDAIKRIPQEAITAITKQIEKVRLLEEPLVRFNNQLKPIYDPLNELRRVLDQRIGVKAPYPCGVKTCYHEQSYPCGAKTCKKNCGLTTCTYPCGVKTCSQKVPYPCGVKSCDVDISMSVADALKGADAIEHKIESILSSTIYTALKEVGLGSIKRELEDKANALVKPVLSALDLHVDTSLPRLDVDFDMKMIEKGIADIAKFEAELAKLSAIIDMHSPTFQPHSVKLEKMYVDMKGILSSPRCQASGR